MSRVYSTDLRHGLDASGRPVREPSESARTFRICADLAAAARLASVRNVPVKTPVRCFVPRGRGRCRGRVTVMLDSERSAVGWLCPECGSNGSISGWEGTPFDDIPEDDRSRDGVVRDPVSLPVSRFDELLAGDSLDRASRRALLRGLLVDRDTVEVALSADESTAIASSGKTSKRAGSMMRDAESAASPAGGTLARRQGLLFDPGAFSGEAARNPGRSRIASRPSSQRLASFVDSCLAGEYPPSVIQRQRAHGFSPVQIRSELLRRLRAGEAGAADDAGWRHVFGCVRIRGSTNALAAIARDAACSEVSRCLALTAIREFEPAVLGRLLAAVSKPVRERFATFPLEAFLLASIRDARSRVAFEMTLADPNWRIELTDVERARKFAGISAREIYSGALRHVVEPRRADSFARRLLEEGEAGANAVRFARACTVVKEVAESLDRALGDPALRDPVAAAAKDSPQAARAQAFLAECDDDGIVGGAIVIERKKGARYFLSCRMVLSGELLDVEFEAGPEEAEIQRRMRVTEAQTGRRFVRFPVGMVVDELRAASSRAPATGRKPHPRILDAMKRLESLLPVEAVERATDACSTRPVAEPTIRETPMATWRFRRADLEAIGLDLAREPASAANLRRIAASPLSSHVDAMLAHATHWSGAGEDYALAGSLARERDRLRSTPEESELLSSMVRAGVEPSSHRLAMEEPGDESLRRWLRERFYRSVNQPRGVDVARLDQQEAAIHALRRSNREVRIAEMLRDDEIERASHAIAVAVGVAPALDDPTLRERCVAVFTEFSFLSPKTRRCLVDDVLRTLARFRAETCRRCRVRCFENSSRAMTAAFRSREHPSRC